jgi:hypothetical protein
MVQAKNVGRGGVVLFVDSATITFFFMIVKRWRQFKLFQRVKARKRAAKTERAVPLPPAEQGGASAPPGHKTDQEESRFLNQSAEGVRRPRPTTRARGVSFSL